MLLLLLISVNLPAEDFSGRISNDLDEGVGFATLVIPELDLLATTKRDGTFTLTEVEPGTYAVQVIAPGYVEWDGSVEFTDELVMIVIQREVIEMSAITVVAEALVPEEILDNEVDSEELERLPPRSDPFDAITQESGILKDFSGGFFGGPGGPNDGPGGDGGGPGDGPISLAVESGTLGRLNRAQGDRISVYGGESDWNNYYYDYIRMPTNTHAFGYPEPGAIVPVEAVDTIAIYKGVIPVDHGPAIGGLFTLTPALSSPGVTITATPSIMDVGFLVQWELGEDTDLLVSANQSIVQYTVLPLIFALSPVESEDEVVEEGDPTSFSYGDALLRFTYAPPRHELSLDAIAYYDSWLFDLAFGDFALNSEYGPYYIATGSNWKYMPSTVIANSLYVYGSYYNDFGIYNFRFPTTIDFSDEASEPDAFQNIHIDWISNVTSLQAGNELSWNLSPSTTLLLGVNARLDDLRGTYVEEIVQTDLSDNELSNEVLDLPGIDEVFFSGYGYAKVIGHSDPIKFNGGAGVLWYPSEGTVRASVNAELLYANEFIVAAIGAGWSPGIIDEFSYIDRRLDEQYYELESITDLGEPPMAFSAATQLVYIASDRHTLGVSPYFAWYYDLSGIAINTSGSDLDGAFISYDPAKGYSTGIDINWKSNLAKGLDLSVSYAFAWTRYLTDEWGWVAPNSEVGHALKAGLLYKSGGLKVGQNLLVYSGIPFTPEIVTENELGTVIVNGDYNSAIEYFPYFDVKTNITYTWEFKRFDLSLFFNSSNWLSVANGSMNGIKPELIETVGATSANFSDREYNYSTELADFLIILLLSEIGLSFSL